MAKRDSRPRLTQAQKIFDRAEAIAALCDVRDNDGMMWRAKTGHEAAALWKELRRRGWVLRGQITPTGRAVLASVEPQP